MDGDYLEGRGRDVEVREAGVLQVVKVSLGQSVPAMRRASLEGVTQEQRDTQSVRETRSHRK